MMMHSLHAQHRRPTRIALAALALLFLLGGLFLAAAHASSREPQTPPQASSQAPALSSSQLSPAQTKVLGDIRAKDKDQLSVGEEDGRFLRMLVASTQRKPAREIGTAYGYSAIWIGLGLRDTGGKLVTIEIDPTRAQEATDNIKKAGLTDVVTVISGDAFKEIPKLAGTFDCVFVDAWKRDYIKFFDMTYPRMDKGGLFLGHNVVNKKS